MRCFLFPSLIYGDWVDVNGRLGAFGRYGVSFIAGIIRVGHAEMIIRMGKDSVQFLKGTALFERKTIR